MIDPHLMAQFVGLSREELERRLRDHISQLDLTDRFVLLHQLGIYHHPETISGAGSTLAETRTLRQALPMLLQRERVRSILDIPCGDFHWMRFVDLTAIAYTGADIVPEIIMRNQRLYQTEQRVFTVLDATRDSLPCVDLVFSRDLLIHLSLADIWRFLRNVVTSGSGLLLTSHFTDHSENLDIESGDFRPVNLCRGPFWLPTPRQVVIEESCLGEGRYWDRSMALWSIADIRPALAEG